MAPTPPQPPPPPPPADSVRVVLPQVSAPAGAEFDVPVRVEGAKNLGAVAATLTFAPPVPNAPLPRLLRVTPTLEGFEGEPFRPDQIVVDTNPDTNRVHFFIVADRGLTGSGLLYRATFQLPADAPAGGVYAIALGNAQVLDATLGNPRTLLYLVTPGALTVQ